MTTLIVYYSLTGNARTVAAALARELDADIEELRCGRYSSNLKGALMAGYDSWRNRLPALQPLTHDPSAYNLIVLGGPIWAFRPCTPVRAFLAQEVTRLPRVAFFLTYGGSAAQRALREMEQIAQRSPLATMAVREAEVKSEKYGSAVASFAASLRVSEAAA